jgi:thiol-disulfide isomerase/thioredoxin
MLELVDAAAATDEHAQIAAEIARAQRDGKRLVVYVGATWCEPCREFHAAAEAGKLDATFPELRMLVFDADRDTEALRGAGYVSDLIPLFAIPRADGMASGHQIEGSKTGTDAVAEISPRLRALLDGPQ